MFIFLIDQIELNIQHTLQHLQPSKRHKVFKIIMTIITQVI